MVPIGICMFRKFRIDRMSFFCSTSSLGSVPYVDRKMLQVVSVCDNWASMAHTKHLFCSIEILAKVPPKKFHGHAMISRKLFCVN